ncbi:MULTISPECIES: TauD/TfdA family dioxygenase [Flavobacteriaceae]|uniref:TauD/TfdA family dioxygenase n=1 Tax=Flavobacteriaceae TaxID=49546 RepID=UPI0039E8D54A
MRDRLNKLKNISAKSINVEEENIIERVKDTTQGFPLVIETQNANLNLKSWIHNNKEKFEQDIINYGGVLFRGFEINSVDKFQDLMNVFPNELLEYKLRSSPRHSISGNVYVSTTYPNDQIINMHSESSYAPVHPSRIIFCCVTPALKNGETPIADTRKVLKNLSRETVELFREKEIKYRRNLNGVLGLSWQEVFQTNDKTNVEKECLNNGMQFCWKGDNELVISWTKKAIWEHPITNEEIWFNHGLFFNKYMLNKGVLSSISDDEQLPNNTFFGDGTEISKEIIEEINNAFIKSTVSFPWEKGDVLFLDNLLMAHGRNTYEGERKVIVSMY